MPTNDEHDVRQIRRIALQRVEALVEIVGRADCANHRVDLIRRTADPGGPGVADRLLLTSPFVAARLNAIIKPAFSG